MTYVPLQILCRVPVSLKKLLMGKANIFNVRIRRSLGLFSYFKMQFDFLTSTKYIKIVGSLIKTHTK